MHTIELDHFWSEFHQILSIALTAPPEAMDSALRQAITLISSNLVEFLSDEQSLHRAISALLHSPLFQDHHHNQRSTNLILLVLIDPTTPFSLIFVACLALLLNGFEDPVYFRTLRAFKFSALHLRSPQESHLQAQPAQPSQLIPILLAIGARIGLVPSLLIHPAFDQSHSEQRHTQTLSTAPPDPPDPTNESYAERKLKPLIAGLLYELCRVQKLENEIIHLFSEELIDNLFELVELTRDQEDETLNYNLIKLIIALNEQFMIAGLHHQSQPYSHQSETHHCSSDSQDNIIIRTMKRRLNESKTFGENLIFILNRASHSTSEGLCVSLLILKILYLLFTTPGTHEYFYKNDLQVLVDIFIRELSNLPDEHNDLRHTYLRVLHPLLTQTQLRSCRYKREEIRQVLLSHVKYAHLQDLNPTTKRLIQRNLQSEWCLDLGKISEPSLQKPDLPRLRPTLKRFPSQDTLESQLSGGSSFAEVTSSNTENKILARMESPVNLGNPHKDLSSPQPSSGSQSQSTQIQNHKVSVPSTLQSPAMVQDMTQAFVQVIIADTDQLPGPSGVFPNPPAPLSSIPSSELIHLPTSLLTSSHVRSVSPISEGSPTPSSPGSISHSSARRPAPKPPICKRGGQGVSSRPFGLGNGHPSIIQPNPQIIQPSSPIVDTFSYSLSLSSSSSLVDEHVAAPEKTTRRRAPTPPHLDSHLEERIVMKSHRRKAPLPPTNHHGIPSLRGTKSNSHLISSARPQCSTLLPSTSNPDGRSNRIVSLSHHFSPASHLSSDISSIPISPSPSPQTDTNPFAD